MKLFYAAIGSLLVLSACSSTSDGKIALGVKGSYYWAITAPEQDVRPFLDSKRTYELCTAWNRYPDAAKLRRRIADALVRRGEPEDKCYNPAADAIERNRRAQPDPVRTIPIQQSRPTRAQCVNYGGPQMTYCTIQ